MDQEWCSLRGVGGGVLKIQKTLPLPPGADNVGWGVGLPMGLKGSSQNGATAEAL